MSKPPALTVQRLQELRYQFAKEKPGVAFDAALIERNELLSLLAMAERSVSEETVRKLAEMYEADTRWEKARKARVAARGESTAMQHWEHMASRARGDFSNLAERDLRAAATRLRQGGEGNG